MKFSDMIYVRPDLEEFKAVGAECIEKVQNAKSGEELEKVFTEWDTYSSKIYTMYAIAYVRHTINTEDKFYDEEVRYLDEVMPLCSETTQTLSTLLVNSPYRKTLEEKFGSLMFKNIEIGLKTFSPEIIPDLQEENRLSTEYAKLIASAQIEFQGEKRTLSQLTPFKKSADDEVRRLAWEADGNFYAENAEKFDRLYDDLVKVRDRMAKKLGYENYIELGYYRMTRNCYDKNDVEKFRAAVRKHLVPIADKLYRQQAERLGVSYPLTYPNSALSFRSGNPTPKGTADEILAHAKTFYHELSDETAEFIDFLYENELLDVLSKKGKASGGYCIGLTDYNSPFIFANFNGTSGDVEVMTHEAGHAFAAYVAKDIRPTDLQSPTMESCEIHSMSMEFFAWDWAEGFFGDDTLKFKYNHLADALEFIPYGTMVDHFQHIVYEKPEMTPEERHAEWKKLTGIYMPWINLDGSVFYGEGKAWQRQTHIYERPFYYIDYCLAQTVALQFWALNQSDHKDAWSRYFKLVSKAGTTSFNGLVETAGLATPFGDTALKEVAEVAEKWLSSIDTTKLA